MYTTTKIRAELGIRPRYSLAAGLAQTYEWYVREGLDRRDVDFSAEDAPPVTRPTVLVYHADPRYAELMRVPKRGALVRTAATPREAAEPISEAEILYAWKFPPQLYAKAGRLKWLQVMGAGVDWALVPELPPGVQVTRAPGIFGPWMAEYVIGWCSWVTQRMRVLPGRAAPAPLARPRAARSPVRQDPDHRRARRHRP